MDYEEFMKLDSKLRNKITEETLKDIFAGQQTRFCLQNVLEKNRELSLAVRLISKGRIFISEKGYTADDILECYQSSAEENGYTYYPLRSILKSDQIKRIYFCVKKGKYEVEAVATIEDIYKAQDNKHTISCPDPSVINDKILGSQQASCWLKIKFVDYKISVTDLISVKSFRPLEDTFIDSSQPLIIAI